MKTDEYLALIYRELEKRGISRNDAGKIMKAVDFSPQKYPEILRDTVPEKVDELIVVATILMQIQENFEIPSGEKDRLISILIRCIRSGNIEDRYMMAKKEVEYRFKKKIADISI